MSLLPRVYRLCSRVLFSLLAGFILTGCSTLGYLFQASKGQLSLMQHARPIVEVVQDERTPPRIRELLSYVPLIKAYGEKNGMKSTRNYTEYVKLNRKAAVWVVSACEELRFESKEWKFPVVGSFPYLGWFDLEDARQFASELKSQGWDVDLRGAAAYSTLGWFRDAILSSMIPEGQEALGELINVVLHESVHATLYIQGQAYFDESVASFVADHMTPQYLAELKGNPSPEFEAYVRDLKESEEIQQQFHEAYLHLEALYSSKDNDEQKKAKKKLILSQLQGKLKSKREINNATLIQYKEYHSDKKSFEALFDACEKDWKNFFKALSQLNRDSFARPQQEDLVPVLKPLIEGHC